MKETISIGGMHCASCAINIERKLRKAPGVVGAEVSYANENAIIDHDGTKKTKDIIEQEVARLGYKIVPKDQEEETRQREQNELKSKLYISSTLTLVILIGSFPQIFTFTPLFLQDPIALFALTIPIQFYIGWPFYRSTFASLRNRLSNMDTLIAFGTTAAFIFSTLMTFFPDLFMKYGIEGHYFDVSAVVITLVLLGKYLETSAKGRTGSAIKKLLGLQSKTAHKVSDHGIEEISISQVQIGDILQVRPGDKIPVDGQVTLGQSVIDESMISGEPIPVEKGEGSTIIGGTVNKNSVFQYRATRIGKDTLLAQIIELVQTAQSSRAPIQKLADTISAYFVPMVLIIATLTFVVWYDFGPQPALLFGFLNAVGVLVIACPCALGLATPTAIMVGTGIGAQHGILIKNAEKLEKLHKATIIVFDKTGTITKGKPEVSDYTTIGDYDQKELLIKVASLEAVANHPLGEAITQYAQLQKLQIKPVTNIKAVPGKGIKGHIGTDEIVIGEKLLIEEEIEIKEALREKEKLQNQGKTVILVAVNRTLVGIIAITDPIKGEAFETVQLLKKQNIKTMLLTGDNNSTAQKIVTASGIDTYKAEVLPQEKEAEIRKLQAQGETVIMVGDGINDAPALAAADIGIAMGTGTDIAIETSDVTLLGGDIRKIPLAISLSRNTLRTIKQNLFWAFGYNIILIPVAAGLLYPFGGFLLNPMLASAAMALSSVSVVLNSLRLNLIKLK